MAALLVSVTQFAWQVYCDLSKDWTEASPEVLARKIRLKVEVLAPLTAADRNHLIAVVIKEILASAPKV